MPVRAPSSARRRAARTRLPACAGLAFAVAAVAGCGSAAVADLPPAATPALSPPLTTAPTGRVVRLGPPLAELGPGRTAAAGGAPEGLAFDAGSGRLAVALRDPAQLALVEAGSGRVAARVGLPGEALHLAAQAGEVLVPAGAAGRLLRVRAADGRVVADVALGGRPHDVAAGDDGAAEAFTAGGAAVSVVQGGQRTRVVPAASDLTGVTAVAPGRVAVVSGRERAVELLDAASGDRLGRAAAGVGPTHAVAHDRWLWVVDTRGDALLVFRTAPRLELVRRVFLPGGPYGIALDTQKLRLWVTLTRTNEVAEFPAHGHPHELRRLPTVRQPDSVAVDPLTHRVFVAGRHDGVLELIDPPPLR